MIGGFWIAVGLLALWGGIVMLRRRQEYQSPKSPGRQDDDIDHAALEAAEREVRDLDTDAKGRPLDEGVGDDWGPGTPKPPYV